MRLQLDTQILLWFAQVHPLLKTAVAEVIEDEANEILVSTLSLWEVAIKVRVGKLTADAPALVASCFRQGFRILDLSPLHVAGLMSLPWDGPHRDPFDHMLLTQAAAEGATFVSADAQLGRYGVPLLNCG